MDCCCVGQDLVLGYVECCNGGTTVYVPEGILQNLGCSSYDTIKIMDQCYSRLTWEPPIRRDVAIQRGYTIVPEMAVIVCALRCQQDPCPQCPDNCCIIQHIPAVCDETGGGLLCCNRGSFIQVVARKDITTSYVRLTSINASSEGYCPPGCTWGYESSRFNENEYDEYTGTYKKCDEEGQYNAQISCSREYVRNTTQVDTYYGFEGYPGGCLSSFEVPTQSEYRDTECEWLPMTGSDAWLPPPYTTPGGYGPTCILNGHEEHYDNIPGLRTTCTYSLNRDRACFTGSYVLQIDCVTKIHPNAHIDSCPPPNAITGYSSTREVYEYSILTLSSDFCDPSFCDGPGGRPPKTPDFNVDNGALVLL